MKLIAYILSLHFKFDVRFPYDTENYALFFFQIFIFKLKLKILIYFISLYVYN